MIGSLCSVPDATRTRQTLLQYLAGKVLNGKVLKAAASAQSRAIAVALLLM